MAAARRHEVDRSGQLGRRAAAAQLDDLADVPAQRLGVQRAADRDRRRQHVAVLQLGQLGEPGGLVDRVADHGVLEAGLRADVPGDGPARGHPDAEVGLAEDVDQLVVQLAGRGQRGTGGVGMLDRGAEDGQRRVALELVDEPAVPVDGVDDDAEELVEQADDLGRRARVAASCVEPTRSTKSTATSRSWPPSSVPRSSARRATSSPT